MINMLKILVANDDGINAAGIRALVNALHNEAGAEIYVFAPDGQRSASGHSISLHKKINLRPVEYENAKAAFAVSGTPADCVCVGTKVLSDMGIKPDMVFAGINHGSNVGTDIVYSGTVATALEGSIQGFPSVAVSVDSTAPEHFENACRLAVDIIEKTGGKWDSDIVINVNTPDIPAEKLKGVLCTIIGEREYLNDIQKTEPDTDAVPGTTSFIYAGQAIKYDSNDTEYDVIAVQHGYASITPLHRDLTAHHTVDIIKEWRIGQ